MSTGAASALRTLTVGSGGRSTPFGAVRARARSFPLFPRPSELGVRGASRGHAVRSPAQGWGFGCAGSAVRR